MVCTAGGRLRLGAIRSLIVAVASELAAAAAGPCRGRRWTLPRPPLDLAAASPCRCFPAAGPCRGREWTLPLLRRDFETRTAVLTR